MLKNVKKDEQILIFEVIIGNIKPLFTRNILNPN